VAATPIPLVIAEAMEVARVKGVDAASNLAADVNAAAEALDNLKSLLRRQLPDPDLARVQRAPEPSLKATSASENQPRQFPPMMSAHALPQVPVALLLPADLVHAAEPRRFDILGFLVGVALSAAIGVVVYIYLAGR
jgi:hypothetical protein